FLLDPKMDEPIHERNFAIAQQDIDVLEDVAPIQTPSKFSEEVLVPADAPIAEYRKWLNEFKSLGWKIDVESFRQSNANDRVFSIPGPGRNKSKNYPIQTIPLTKKERSKNGAILRLTKK
ncbi:MAG TPA: hypothetical protein QGG41_00880, partial [Gammaproteobacteria bacterium]|nr:hypothetical protein [Gammaproteobacteria bacterium]